MTVHQTGADDREIALEARDAAGAKLFSPSVARNREAIVTAFAALMPAEGTILELGSGTGEHAAAIAGARPGLTWQPSDPDPASRASIFGHGAAVPEDRVRPPLDLDATAPGWWTAAGVPSSVDGVVSINMIHIAPFAAAEGLFEGAAALLPPRGRLFLYGPFSRRGAMAESNGRFDQDLKRRDPSWGVRDLDDRLQPLGARFALALGDVREMPANNLSVVFEKQ